MVASSAARTVVLLTSTFESSSLTSAVRANRCPIYRVDRRSERVCLSSGPQTELVVPESFTAEVTMLRTHGDPREALQARDQLFGYRHGTVLSPRAAYRDRGVAFVLALVPGEHGRQGGHVRVDELFCAGLAEHVLAHLGVLAGQRPQLRNPEGIGKEARVGDEVGVC